MTIKFSDYEDEGATALATLIDHALAHPKGDKVAANIMRKLWQMHQSSATYTIYPEIPAENNMVAVRIKYPDTHGIGMRGGLVVHADGDVLIHT
jgi:hypothetical protein